MEAPGEPPVAALSSLQAKFSVYVVLTAGELFCDYLIIAIVADNRIWQKNSAHPVLGLDRDTDLWIRAWQLSPEPRTPASHSPLSPPFGHPQACPFGGFVSSAITSSVLHSGFLAKEKWAEQTLFSPWSVSCDPHGECDLVWRRQPCLVGCCVLKPDVVTLCI